MKLDILVLAAHPDDAELCCGGTIAKHVKAGYKVGIVDLTRGELGTRGTPEIRDHEAAAAAKILGLSVRENLKLEDGFFKNDREHQLAIIRVIRKYQPKIILANAVYDRHPDHGRAASLEYDASFLAGLAKIETLDDAGQPQQPWRPRVVYHYIQSIGIQPDFAIDITDFWEQKVASYMAFKSQVFDPTSSEPQTFISSPEFLKLIEARAIEYGTAIGVKYAEAFTVRRLPGVRDLFDML